MGAGDLEFNIIAYVSAFISCTTQTAFLLLIKKTSSQKNLNLNTFGLLYEKKGEKGREGRGLKKCKRRRKIVEVCFYLFH